MTLEQKYGRFPDGLEDLETPPEDWQFENSKPIKITGRKPAEVPKLNLAAILPNKEVDEVNFIKLNMDKQIKLVAEEYNKGLGPSAIQRKLGIVSPGTYYDRLDKAKAMGLVTGKGDVVARTFPRKPDISITPDFFKEQAECRRVKAEDLSQQAERLEQASEIASALTDLLGESAQDLVNGLYARVS